jgi:HK97 family phage portal protein
MPFPLADTLRGLFRPETKSADPAPEPVTLIDPSASWLFGALPTYTGTPVTPASAMSVTAVSCAVELISELIGTLPAKLYNRGEDGARTTDPTDPIYRLVHNQANDWTSASELRTQLTRDALLHDLGGFALAVRVEGRVAEFIRLPPTEVSVELDAATLEPSYLVGQPGKSRRRYSYTDILRVQAFGHRAPITRARNAISLALVLEEHAGRLFGNGARPSGVLSFPSEVTPPAIKNAIDVWGATHGGSGNAGKTAVVAAGGSWSPMALTSVDSQFLETRRHQTEEIARAFMVPPTMLFDLERGTWANTEEMQRQFLTYCLRPWLRSWCDAYSRVLLTPDQRRTQYVEFVIDDLLRADFAARMQGYSTAIASRILSPNEARAAENRPPYAGSDKFENPNTLTANSNTPTPEDAAA